MKPSSLALAALAVLALSSPAASAFAPAGFPKFGAVPSPASQGQASSELARTAWYVNHAFDASSVKSTMGRSNTSLGMATGGTFPGQPEDKSADDDEEEEDEDEDEDSDEEDSDDEDDEYAARRRRMKEGAGAAATTTAFAGLKLDPYDPNPPIKPRPSRKYGFTSPVDDTLSAPIPDDQLVQSMSADERRDNLEAMRQIKKFDLADLRLRKDHAGWVEANNDLKARTRRDPWFGVNDRLREAIQLGEEGEVDRLRELASKLGGPPPGVDVSEVRGYALYTEIFDVGMSSGRAASMLEQEILDDRVKRGRAMAAEARANQEKARRKFEEKMRGGGENTEEKEAKERRERMMSRLMGELEEDKKKREERAKEALGKLPDMPEDIQSSFDRALKEAQDDVRKQRRRERLGDGVTDSDDDTALPGSSDEGDGSDSSKKSYAAKAREQAAAEASGGRPRLPGDEDVTRGEITVPIEQSSTATSGPLTVEVTSGYNADQSDPPMRKHCFQYTIRITNNSASDTVQLLSRRFEIQTVGSSMKDVVQGEGVTGRQPVLKPGEVFEYTSTAPLSVRPIGTTEIAARMRGHYRYVVLEEGQEAATPEQVKESSAAAGGEGAGGGPAAELGMFHFVFPEEQRVKPFKSSEGEEEDDDEEDDEDDDAAPMAEAKAQPTGVAGSAGGPSAAKAAPSSTLPGDPDMEAADVHPRDSSVSDSSDTLTSGVRVRVTTSYKPERSDAKLDKHCFQYNIRITNESDGPVQLVSRRFEIQTVGSPTKDVVQGPGVTGRQPILKPGESFEYNSTAPLSVKPVLEKTPVVARMEGEYNFVSLGEDGQTPTSSTPLQAKLGRFHFILPALEGV